MLEKNWEKPGPKKTTITIGYNKNGGDGQLCKKNKRGEKLVWAKKLILGGGEGGKATINQKEEVKIGEGK